MSDQPEFLTCTCNHCGQKLEFAAKGVGQEIQCPTCGKPTLLSRSAPTPVPPLVRPSRQMSQGVKPESGKAEALPLAGDSTRSAPPKAEFVIRFSRRAVLAVIVTTVILLAIGLPCIYVWQKRAQETEQLKTELRLLEAQIQTGLSYNDFLAQVARIRATHLATQDTLNQSQEAQYGKLDFCLKTCPDFWDHGAYWYIGQDVLRDSVLPPLVAKFGFSNPLYLHGDWIEMLSRTTEDIEAFLNDQPCPWPK